MKDLLQHRGIVALDHDLVVERLQLPVGTVILEAKVNLFHGGQVELLVSHPDLPVCDPGCVPMDVGYHVEAKYRV